MVTKVTTTPLPDIFRSTERRDRISIFPLGIRAFAWLGISMKKYLRFFAASAAVFTLMASTSRAQPAPAGGDAEIAQLKRRLAELEAQKAAMSRYRR
jgi:hypothetical protein